MRGCEALRMPRDQGVAARTGTLSKPAMAALCDCPGQGGSGSWVGSCDPEGRMPDLGGVLRVALGGGAVAALVAAMIWHAAPSRPGPTVPSARAMPSDLPEAWSLVADPDHVFALDPGVAGAPLAMYEARSGPDLREDRAVYGRFDGDGNMLALIFTRGRASVRGPATYFLALVRSAAAEGLAVLQVGPRLRLDTKFGMAEVAQTVLARHSERACLSFRIRRTSRDYGLTGWLCGEGADIRDLSHLERTLAAVAWRATADPDRV